MPKKQKSVKSKLAAETFSEFDEPEKPAPARRNSKSKKSNEVVFSLDEKQVQAHQAAVKERRRSSSAERAPPQNRRGSFKGSFKGAASPDPARGQSVNPKMPSDFHVHAMPLYERRTKPVLNSKLTRQEGRKAAWDIGCVSKAECEHAVLAAESGDFLVRHGSDGKSYVICVNDSCRVVQNYQVTLDTGGSVILARETYPSLEDGIAQLRASPLQLRSGRSVFLGKSASACKWFVGCMHRTETDRLLMASGNCDFVVRLDVRRDATEYEVCINDKGHIARFSIMRSRSGEFVTSTGQFFKTLGDLLDHARDEAIFKGDSGRNLYLRKAAGSSKWYCGKMKREIVEDAVRKGTEGSYLVRQSNKNPDDFVLVCNHNDEACSFKIKRNDNGFAIAGKVQNSMESVIRHVIRNPLKGPSGSDLKLTNPAKRPIDDVEVFGEEKMRGGERRRSLKRGDMARAEAEAAEMSLLVGQASMQSDDGRSNNGAPGKWGDKIDKPFRAVVLNDCPGGGDNLEVKKGESVFVFSKKDNLYACVASGKTGFVEEDNVEEEDDAAAEARRKAAVDEELDGFGDDDEAAAGFGGDDDDDNGGGDVGKEDGVTHDPEAEARAEAEREAERQAAAAAAEEEYKKKMEEIAAMQAAVEEEITGFD